MKAEEKNRQDATGRLPEADTGNASNPTPREGRTTRAGNNQLLDEEAETYLRESANIEDLPDPQQEQDADELLEKNENSK